MGGIADFAGNILEGGKDLLVGDYQESAKNLANDSLYAISTPGGSLVPQGKEWSLTRSPGLEANIQGLRQNYLNQATEIGRLKPLVEPGFGRLTETGVRAIQDARRASIGDLRENLSRRRVLGSSFAQDDINRTNAEYQKIEDQFRAETFIKELEMKNQLINQQFQARAQGFLEMINQFNFESGVASQLATGVTSVLGANARTAAGIQATFQSDFMQGLGDITGTVLGNTFPGTFGGG